MTTSTAFVESCVQTATGQAIAAARGAKGRPRAKKLLRLLADKKNILITTHQHPDPDALASSIGLRELLRAKLKDASINVSIKGNIGGGLNDAFIVNSQIDLSPWDDAKLREYDAIIMLDVQPMFAYSPLPPDISPTAVIDHHRTRGRKLNCPFCDIRTDVGATSSIIFSYFMDLEVAIKPSLAATLLYAIESDIAGAAGTPGGLDNLALSSLTLLADTQLLYAMRYVDLPQNYYAAYHSSLGHATVYDGAIVSYIDKIVSIEQPAVIADFLLRYDKVQWALVCGLFDNKLIFSLRTSDPKKSAGDVARRLITRIGFGGGHRTKAGGYVSLANASDAEIERGRKILRRRLLRALGIPSTRGQKLISVRD